MINQCDCYHVFKSLPKIIAGSSLHMTDMHKMCWNIAGRDQYMHSTSCPCWIIKKAIKLRLWISSDWGRISIFSSFCYRVTSKHPAPLPFFSNYSFLLLLFFEGKMDYCVKYELLHYGSAYVEISFYLDW